MPQALASPTRSLGGKNAMLVLADEKRIVPVLCYGLIPPQNIYDDYYQVGTLDLDMPVEKARLTTHEGQITDLGKKIAGERGVKPSVEGLMALIPQPDPNL